jgi:hypothetical protein
MKRYHFKDKVIYVPVEYKSDGDKIYPSNAQSMMSIWGSKTVVTDHKYLHKDEKGSSIGYFFIQDIKNRLLQLKRKKRELEGSIEIIEEILKGEGK